MKFSHVKSDGTVKMVDISDKKKSKRMAMAECIIKLNPEIINKIKKLDIKKGDVLNTARIAGILASKNTGNVIPLTHNINISHCSIDFSFLLNKIKIISTVKTEYSTGIEMEALYAAVVSALTIYDMVKAVSKDFEIEKIHLLFKSGGKSGVFKAI